MRELFGAAGQLRARYCRPAPRKLPTRASQAALCLLKLCPPRLTASASPARVFSQAGSYALNAAKGKKERIGRLMQVRCACCEWSANTAPAVLPSGLHLACCAAAVLPRRPACLRAEACFRSTPTS